MARRAHDRSRGQTIPIPEWRCTSSPSRGQTFPVAARAHSLAIAKKEKEKRACYAPPTCHHADPVEDVDPLQVGAPLIV
jgi:hypothetical protein